MVIKHGTVDCLFCLCSFLFWGERGGDHFGVNLGIISGLGVISGSGSFSGAVQDSLSKLSLLLKDVSI